MIFFGIPSVGQIKSSTLFENEDHFGFIQTLIGTEYSNGAVAKRCDEYYSKEGRQYWGRIITLINALALKPTTYTGIVEAISLIASVAECYDKGEKIYANILLEYVAVNWQYPHPILTKNTGYVEKEWGINIGNQRRDMSGNKPIRWLLELLGELWKIDVNESYLKQTEFVELWRQYYVKRGVTEDPRDTAKEIIVMRYNETAPRLIKIKGPYLSYPLGLIKNIGIITIDRAEYNQDEIYIGLSKENGTFHKLEKLLALSDGIFDFDRIEERNIHRDYSKYLYDSEKFDYWLKAIHRMSWSRGSGLDKEANYSDKRWALETQLSRLDKLDTFSITRRRTEQHILREYILGNKGNGNCAICNHDFPSNLLATAHIKKRSECSLDEKRDLNVVMPACYLGCDTLYEKGYVRVNEGVVERNKSHEITDRLDRYLREIEGNECKYYGENTSEYFKHHYESTI